MVSTKKKRDFNGNYVNSNNNNNNNSNNNNINNQHQNHGPVTPVATDHHQHHHHLHSQYHHELGINLNDYNHNKALYNNINQNLYHIKNSISDEENSN